MASTKPNESLLARYLNGTATQHEIEEVEQWYREQLNSELIVDFNNRSDVEQLRSKMLQRLNVELGTQESHKTTRHLPYWWAAACIVAAVVVSTLWLNRMPTGQRAVSQNDQLANDALPGTTRATLTLSDGRKIQLDTAATGVIAVDAGSPVRNLQGQLSYSETTTTVASAINELATAKGQQYALTLSDGTKVWLNAESAIRFPIHFTGNERMVDVKGEAYFEVAKENARPFRVRANNVLIQVTGTHFNVNAYSNEPAVYTTLLEGSVNVSAGNHKVMLKPGEQAVANENTTSIIQANTEEVMAWKNGYFQFEETDIKQVLRQLSRWYDVDVVYEGSVPNKQLVGQIPRQSKLSTVLKALAYTGIEFRIENKTIIVENK